MSEAPAVKKERKPRTPGAIKIFVGTGADEQGREQYTLLAEELGTSSRKAIAKAMESGSIDSVKMGDQLVAVVARSFTPKPLTLSI